MYTYKTGSSPCYQMCGFGFELCEDYLLVLFCLHSTFVEVGGFLRKGVRLGFALCSDWSGWLNSVEVHVIAKSGNMK